MEDGSSPQQRATALVGQLNSLVDLYNSGQQSEAEGMLLDRVLPTDPDGYLSFAAIGGMASVNFRRHAMTAAQGSYWTIGIPRDQMTGKEVPLESIDPGSLFALRFVVAICNEDMGMARAMYDALVADGNAAFANGLTTLLRFSAACARAEESNS